MFDFFKNKHVLVTGGTGFIGSNLIYTLKQHGAKIRIASSGMRQIDWELEYDEFCKGNLINLNFCKEIVKDIDCVFHVAAQGFTSISDPNQSKYDFNTNMLINANMFNACRDGDPQYFQFVSSVNVCDAGSSILSDEIPWKSHPHDAQKYFAWTKRMGELQLQSIHELGFFKGSIVRIGAAYGPKDNFELKTARVIPSIISKIHDNSDALQVWGSGNALRSFVYIDDVVESMLLCMEKYSTSDPLNIGSSQSTSISDLVTIIHNLCKSSKKIIFDTSKPEGIPKITITTDKTKSKIGWSSKISLENGLSKTIEWYKKNILKPN